MVLTIGTGPAAPDRDERLQARILQVLRAGERYSPGLDGRDRGWIHEPGAMPWWAVRQHVGGRVGAAAFAEAIAALLAEGRIVEVWLQRPDARDGRHLLMLPESAAALGDSVAQARGRADVLAAQPWYEGLRGRGAG